MIRDNLRRDPIVRAVGAMTLGLALPLVLPVLSPKARAVYNDTCTTAPFLVLAIVLMQGGVRGRSARERRFWNLMTAGVGCWLAQQILFGATYTLPESLGLSLAQELLYAGLYLLFVLALDVRPHEQPVTGEGGALARLRRAGTVAFVFGLLAYLILVPAATNPESYWSGGPSFTLYIFFDGYLLLRLLACWREAGGSRWRVTYGLLLATCGAWLVLDALEGFTWSGMLPPIDTGTAWDLPWFAPLITLVLAARSRFWSATSAAERPQVVERRETPSVIGSPLVLFALLVPLLHLTLYNFRLFDQATQRAHEWVAFGLLAGLGALVFAYQRALEVHNRRLDAERRRALAQVEHQALHDPLTGLANRRLLWDRLGQAVAEAARRGERLGFVFVDLDDFKAINDAHGHAVGDDALRRIGERLAGQVRISDTVARVGGDEFVVLLTGVPDRETAARLAAKLRGAFAEPFAVGGHELRVGASVGVSLYPDDGEDASGLIAAADAAMYRAKDERTPSGDRSEGVANAKIQQKET